MKKFATIIIALMLGVFGVAGKDAPAPVPGKKTPPPPPVPTIAVREIVYEGKLGENEARFVVELEIEQTGKGTATLPLFEGELAMLPAKLPEGVTLVRDGNRYALTLTKEGRQKLKLELIAKITRAEPWNTVTFTGPAAVIAQVNAQAGGEGVELQLLKGTLLETAAKAGVTRVRGFLGAERAVALRWQSKAAEVTRKALLTCDTAVNIAITPTVVKYTTSLRYDIVQGQVARLNVLLPTTQALTKIAGDGVRDWVVKPAASGQQLLTVDFVRPVEKNYALTLFSEQTVESATASVPVAPPQPQEVERETGSLALTAEDVLVETDAATGLRQVNAAATALAAYQFYARPFTLNLKLRRIEPVVSASDRVGVRLEEARLLVNHALTLKVEKAGIYAVELIPPTGFVVADVRGEGLEDWKSTGGKLLVNFNRRVLGQQRLDVQLEQPFRAAADAANAPKLVIEPLRVSSAVKETTLIGAAAAPGIQLKTVADGLTGVREMPITRLPEHSDEVLAYQTEQAAWKLTLSAERLAARVTADVFNLITIGDGIVGGSATIRYAMLNQGVQEFQVKLPAHWRNVEFTGPSIRRKEQHGDTWTISLQEKAWGGYMLVVTYDFQFDPHRASLPVGGVHAVGVERETGSIAVTSAANLQIAEGKKEEQKAAAAIPAAVDAASTLRRVDEGELSERDRGYITRPVLLAYKYAGEAYELTVDINRFDELPILEAVADRTQLTTVLTDAGQLLTQASFMVKNNDKQFQTFTLPSGADFWSCFVRGEPAKPERSGNKLLVPLPRGINRDEAFAVDIVYAQQIGTLKQLTPRRIALAAPVTDVQATYAEWELFVPSTHRLADFGGNMIVAQGTTYGLQDAWRACIRFYDDLWDNFGGLFIAGLVIFGFGFWIAVAFRRGWQAAMAVVAVVVVLGLFSAMLLPATAKARERARRSTSMNNLKQIGLAIAQFYDDNNGKMPTSLEEVRRYAGSSDAIFTDPSTGERYHYVGPQVGWQNGDPKPLAYGPTRDGGMNILFNDGHVEFSRGEGKESQTLGGFFEGSKPSTAPPSPTTTVATPGPAGSGGGGGGGRGLLPSADASVIVPGGVGGVMPVVAGIRPIRIEIPKTGRQFVFTKVLNMRSEPLTLDAMAMEEMLYKGVRGVAQALLFAAGIALLLWQWWRRKASGFLLALGIALAVAGPGWFLLAYRKLDLAFIALIGLAGLGVFVWIVVAIWRRIPRPQPPVMPPPPLAGTTTALLLAGFLAASAVNAQDLCLPVSSKVQIVSAQYTGNVREVAPGTAGAGQAAQFEATFELRATEPKQTVRLFGDDVAVQEFSGPKGSSGGLFSRPTGEARLVREDGAVNVFLAEKGAATVRVKFLVKLGGDAVKRRLGFAIPQALTSRLAVTIDETEAVVETPSSVSFKTTPEGAKTRVEAVYGATDRVELSWTARTKRAAEIAATVFCQNTALASLGGGVLNVRSVLDYSVTQGELRQMRVRIPAGQRLMRVEGENIRTWKMETDKDTQSVLVELLKGVSPSYRLTVETEKPIDGAVAIDIPHAVDVKRETGLVALKASDELSLSVETANELQKVDVEEFSKAWGADRVPVSSRKGMPATSDLAGSAYRFLKTDFALRVQVSPVQPQIEAVVRQSARISAEQLGLTAQIEYTIKRAGVFALRLALPAGYRVERVAGQNIAQWVEKDDNKVLEVTLKQRIMGGYALQVDLAQTLRELPKNVAVVGVQPLGVEKLSGFISVAAEEGVQMKTDAFDGITEVPAAVAGLSGGNALAFKMIPADTPAAAPGWKLTVNTEKIESWVRAEVVNWVSLTETLVSGRSLVRYEIQNAPTKEFRIKAPAALRNVEIVGANIRRKDQTENEWRIELQNKVRGNYTLVVTWDRPWNVKDGVLELPGIEAAGVERETGWVAVNAPSALRVEPKEAGADLLKADARELPEWAGRADSPAALSYRYLRPGYKLGLAVQRFEEAEVLQALVDNVNLTTVVSEDGQMMTEMKLAIRNNARQYLEVTLPSADAKVWSAFVGGQPVRPSVRGGKVLLPMERSGADGAPVQVELTYVGADKFPKRRGTVSLKTPALDVPLKNARWDLYVPPDYSYSSFEGTMKREVAMAARQLAQPLSVFYNMADYENKEAENRRNRYAETRSSLDQVRSNISAKNTRDAVQFLNRARSSWNDDKANEELKKLEKDVRKEQGKQLRQSQAEFVSGSAMGANAGDIQTRQQQAANQPPVQMEDAETVAVAERQAEKLQKAQEIVMVKALPLRVNLPRRGQLLVFTQTLQTTPREPMNIEFTAVETKALGVPTTVGLGLVSFLALWGVAGLVLRRKNQ